MGKGVKGFQLGNNIGLQNRFSAEKQPKKRGRKQSMYKKALDSEYELSKEDFVYVIRCLLEMNVGELQQLLSKSAKSEIDLPIWVEAFIKGMFGDIKRGRTDLFRYSMNLIFGKEPQRIQITNNINQVNYVSLDIAVLSDEEKKAFVALWQKIHKQRFCNQFQHKERK